MGIYFYCIAPHGCAPATGLVGLDGLPVASMTVGPFALWISELDRCPAPTLERIRSHNRVVEASVSDRVTPLPIRFGEWLASRQALEERVVERREEYESALRSVAGALEFGIRVLDPAIRRPALPARGAGPSGAPAERLGSATAAAGEATGREYMAAVARRVAAEKAIRARAGEVARELNEELASVIRRERVEFLRSPHGLVSLAHLVQRERFHEYHRKVRAIRARMPELRFLLSGPWPPYSFVA